MFFKEVSCLELVFLIWLTFVILQLLVKARIIPMGLCTILQGKLVRAQKDTNILKKQKSRTFNKLEA